MVRSSAKNYAHVTVVTDAADYSKVLKEMKENGGAVSDKTRFELAKKAFSHTAAYDGTISNYLTALSEDGSKQQFPEVINFQFGKAQAMRYGENPHQGAAFYVEADAKEASIATARQMQGKELSYNNIGDADAALECVKQFDAAPACVIVKHANPCGVAYGKNLLEEIGRAHV